VDGVALKAVCAGSQIELTARRVLEKSFGVRGLEAPVAWSAVRSQRKRAQTLGPRH
jgi:hypothetical protein